MNNIASTASQALVWTGGSSLEIQAIEPSPSFENWIPIDVAYVGICGTDLHLSDGHHSRALPGIVLGHEFSGRLASEHNGHEAGTPVFVNTMIHCGDCDSCSAGRVNICKNLRAIGIDYPGAMTSKVFVPIENIYILPVEYSLQRAAIIEPAAVAVRALRRGGVTKGSKVHVFGAGPIGCLVALLSLEAGASNVTLSEPSTTRKALASKLGLKVSNDHKMAADVVFNATSGDAVSEIMVEAIRPGGSVVVVGSYSKGNHPVDLMGVMFTEATIIGSRIYEKEDILAAISLLGQAFSQIESIITDIVPLNQAVPAFDKLRDGTSLKILLKVDQGR